MPYRVDKLPLGEGDAGTFFGTSLSQRQQGASYPAARSFVKETHVVRH